MKKIFISAIAAMAMLSTYAQETIHYPKYEVRAVWLETVDNLDWPKSSSVDAQKKELCDILDKLAAANFNTVLFQAQARGDVAWRSDIQPAMYEFSKSYSSGLPYGFNVCQYVIDECHKRHMECHATIIPYRLGPRWRGNSYNQTGKHPYQSHPELCITYNNQLYLDPGNPATTKYLIELYTELLVNYNFDGVSFDYCRYPGNDFDDAASYKKYNPDNLPKADWRRQNINNFIAEFYKMVQKIIPSVKVGAAPIGTYNNLPGYGNATAYGSYFQDACQWVKDGNCHTLFPQMYWNETYGFTPNMGTWVNNMDGRQFVVGLAPYKMVDGKNNWDPDVITDQITKVRNQEGACGVCFFRTMNILEGQGDKETALYNELKNTYFKYPAHIPPMEYKTVTTPNTPELDYILEDGVYQLKWYSDVDALGTPIKYYSIYRIRNGIIDLDDITSVIEAKYDYDNIQIPAITDHDAFAITAFDYNNYESKPGTASVNEVNTDSDVVVFKSGNTLTITSGKALQSVEIFDATGALALSEKLDSDRATIDCNSMAKGVYIVKISLENNNTVVKKIIR